MRHRITAVSPRSRYDVIPVSPAARCRLRARHRKPATNA